MAEYADNRICYYKLDENKGIAENTNAGLEYATGEYIALLDHDDVLTLDALYEFAEAIEAGKKRGVELQMLYSDEDKCDGDGKTFYEPHYKKDFDFTEDMAKELQDCADLSAQLDARMDSLREHVEATNTFDVE